MNEWMHVIMQVAMIEMSNTKATIIKHTYKHTIKVASNKIIKVAITKHKL